jgi:hypothetical protein
MRIIPYVLAAIVSFAGTNALIRPSVPPSVSSLAAPTTRAGTQIWFVFDPLSCRLSPDVVKRLNAIAVGVDSEFVGVMLNAPPDHDTFARVSRTFGMRFQVIPDSQGKWLRAAHSADIPTPFVVIRNRGRLMGVASLLNYQILPDSIANAIHTLR